MRAARRRFSGPAKLLQDESDAAKVPVFLSDLRRRLGCFWFITFAVGCVSSAIKELKGYLHRDVRNQSRKKLLVCLRRFVTVLLNDLQDFGFEFVI